MIKQISIVEVEYLAHKLAKEYMGFDEPIPDFSSRFPNVLESCVVVPFQKFGGKIAYKGLVEKAAILFYLMIKNHPFQNGNKRIAMTVSFLFLYKNRKWLKVDTKELYNFVVWVAQSPPKLKKETVEAIQHFFRTYLVDL